MPPPRKPLLQQLAAGDAGAITALVAAAILTPGDGGDGLMARARSTAATTRDRQLVAIATAHRRGDRDLVDALARDHLTDHPDNVLVAWIAGASKEPS
jgi:hypothetical protein